MKEDLVISEEALDFIRDFEGACPDCEKFSLIQRNIGKKMTRACHCPNKECRAKFILNFAFSFSWSQVIWGYRIKEEVELMI